MFSEKDPMVVTQAVMNLGYTKSIGFNEDGSINWWGETDGLLSDDAIMAEVERIEPTATTLASFVSPNRYAELRAAEYPSVNDYLDGIVKGDQAQIDAYIAACQAVKTKYPKPE